MERVNLLRTGVALGILMIISVRAFANTYNVTSTSDFAISGGGISVNNANGVISGGAGNGFVTLRSAIAAANNVAGPHTINLGGGTFSLTIAGPAEGFGGDITLGDLDVLMSGITIQGAGMNSTIINQTTGVERLFDVNVNYVSGSVFNFTIDGVTVSGGRSSTANGSSEGGGIFSGNNNANGTVTVTNCKFLNNQTSGAGLGGGAISNVGGNLTVTGCIFGGTNPTDFNQSGTSGGAIYWDARNMPQTFTCTNNSFTNNVALSGAGGGGAIDVAGVNLGSGNVNITGCTFTGNHANSAGGGAIMNESITVNVTRCTFLNNTANRGGAVRTGGGLGTTVSFSRLFGNTATTAGSGFDGSVALNGDNNWWGVNTGPPAGSLAGSATATRWLQLKNTASPSPICIGATSTITASFLSNNLSEAIAAGNLTALVGQLITFNAPVRGTLSGAQTSIQAAGTATVTFTATTAGAGSANAVFVPLTENFTVTTSPTITVSANNTITFSTGSVNQTKAAYTPITTTTWNTTIATGATFASLPPGVNGNWAANVATISGTPTTVGVYNYTVTLTGGCGGGSTGGTITITPALPVHLTSFTGKLNSDKTVTLQWQVEEQQEIQQYMVEESNDGSVFYQSGSVAAGTANSQTYSYVDMQVATGNNYYRLKIVERSGKVSYSKVIMVILKPGITVLFYPNPVTDKLTIQQFGMLLNKSAVLYDGQGKIVQEIKLNNLQQEVNMEKYSAGVYILKLEDGTVFKIMKQ